MKDTATNSLPSYLLTPDRPFPNFRDPKSILLNKTKFNDLLILRRLFNGESFGLARGIKFSAQGFFPYFFQAIVANPGRGAVALWP